MMQPDKLPEYIKQILEALDYLHNKGCYHGRITPSNTLIDQSGVRLSDYGIEFQHPPNSCVPFDSNFQ